jgi:hypothetical protein
MNLPIEERRKFAQEGEKQFAAVLRKNLKLWGLSKHCSVYTHRPDNWFSAFDVIIKFANNKIPNLNIEVKIRNNNFYEFDASGYRKFKFDSFYLNEEKVKRSTAFSRDVMVLWVNSEEMDSIYFLPKISSIQKHNVSIVNDVCNGELEHKYKIPKDMCIHGWGNFMEYISKFIRKDKMFPKWN